jgi:hypothetical protein
MIEDMGFTATRRRWGAARVIYWALINGQKITVTRADYLAILETRRGWTYNLNMVSK